MIDGPSFQPSEESARRSVTPRHARQGAMPMAGAMPSAMSHDDLNVVFTMISTLLWSGLDLLERQQAHGTARVPAPASETG
jgi:hypothetical protein